jgi:hypothetical protein
MPPNEGINWPLWHRSVKNLPSNGWLNYSNNGIKHYFLGNGLENSIFQLIYAQEN